MVNVSGLEFLLAATGIGIAVWAQLIESAPKTIESRDGQMWRVTTATLYICSIIVLASTLFAVGWTSLRVGGVAWALYLVVLSLALASLPTVYVIFKMLMEPFEELGDKYEAVALLIILTLIFISVFALLEFTI